MRKKILTVLVVCLFPWSASAQLCCEPYQVRVTHAGVVHTPTDKKFCGPPPRNAYGVIIRDQVVLRDFEQIYPRSQLPIIMKPDGTSEKWIKDHVVPLACGGCDTVDNLQWLPESQWRTKSKWERKAYGGRGISAGCP